ncbi:MAG: Ig-like domain-containing protein [Chloroflexota bacterium]
MRIMRACLIAGMAVMGSACTLTSDPATPTPATTPTPLITGRPSVTIESPDEGTEVTTGDNVLVSATAEDEGGVTSVQLFANDTLVKTVSSESVAGDRVLPVVLDYSPRSTGNIALEVIAFRGNVASNPATVNITVQEEDTGSTTGSTTGTTGGGPVIDPNDPTCRILTNVNLNYRTGPGTNYERLGLLVAGTQVPITGRLGDNSWWQVQVSSFQQAWVSSEFTTEYGNCVGIPVLSPPPTPTSTAPTPTPPPTLTPEPSITPSVTPVPPTPRPADLVVSSIQGPESLTLSGGIVTGTYSIQVTNAGDSPTGAQFASTLTLLPGGTESELGVIGNLGTGESILLNRQVTFTEAGQVTLQVEVDSGGDINEISEVNNTSSLVITIQAES